VNHLLSQLAGPAKFGAEGEKIFVAVKIDELECKGAETGLD